MIASSSKNTKKTKSEQEHQKEGGRRTQPRPPLYFVNPQGTVGSDRRSALPASKMALPIAGALATSGNDFEKLGTYLVYSVACQAKFVNPASTVAPSDRRAALA
jgi:hypothetical protein